VAAAVPVASFIAWQFRRTPELLRHGVLHRGAFEIMNMRRELSALRQSLTASRAEYEHAKALFSRYVVPDVVDEILRATSTLKLGGEVRDVTILFADIRGYSTLSEHLGPEQIIALLNQYFSAMSEVITKERGTILEFEGDSILVVFGAPLDQPNSAELAGRTPLRMLEQVVVLNSDWEADGTAEHWKSLALQSFKIRIGLHTGEVVVGNVGSEAHTKYAVVGDAVNTAARLEQYNKRLGTTLLMSGATAERLGERLGELGLTQNDFGWHKLRGRSTPVHVLSVWPLPGIQETPLAQAALADAAEAWASAEEARNAEGPVPRPD
jgi:adenylate cyclase